MSQRSRRRRRTSASGIVVFALSGLVCVFLVTPLAIVIPLSFSSASYLHFPPPGLSLRWYGTLLNQPGWLQSLAMSCEIALAATALSVTAGTMAAVALVRGRFPLKQWVYSLMLLPIVLPSVVVAVGLFILFAQVHAIGNPLTIALGHSLLSLPLVVIIVSATLENMDIRIEQAAIVFGAHPAIAFVRVTVPLIAPGVLTALVFAFLTSFDELLIALFLGNPAMVTLPVRIFNATVFTLDPTIAAISSLLIGLTAGALALVATLRWLSARRTALAAAR